jgi:hypothetical protein
VVVGAMAPTTPQSPNNDILQANTVVNEH